MDNEEHFLNDVWSLYFHDPDDEEWTINSYKNQTSISTAEDWVSVNKSFSELWSKGMFFLMREHIQPLWEDSANKSGGCFSFKVNKPEASDFWFKLGSRLLTDELTKDPELFTKISGISISPKRNYCIIRIWVGDNQYKNLDYYNLEVPSYTQVIYKSHQENIDFDSKT